MENSLTTPVLQTFVKDLKSKSISLYRIIHSNGQVEAINKIIKHTLKARLDALKGGWVKEFPSVLWSSMEKTHFSLAFGVEAVIALEMGISSFRK